MDLDQMKICEELRRRSSSDAASWLLANYTFEKGNSGEVYDAIHHRSWERTEQMQLADYYLSNLPHRSERGYQAFLRFMSLPNFIAVISRHLPRDVEQRALIKYHLHPILTAHPNGNKYRSLIDDFLASLA